MWIYLFITDIKTKCPSELSVIIRYIVSYINCMQQHMPPLSSNRWKLLATSNAKIASIIWQWQKSTHGIMCVLQWCTNNIYVHLRVKFVEKNQNIVKRKHSPKCNILHRDMLYLSYILGYCMTCHVTLCWRSYLNIIVSSEKDMCYVTVNILWIWIRCIRINEQSCLKGCLDL